LVEAQAHCAECHTPRNALGGLKSSAWLTGAVLPGEGKVPGITPDALEWSANDIAFYLETGFTPDFDSAGGPMAHVVENMGQLTPEDRDAIAVYLQAFAQ
jgi:mono/diheme cytochrome c family protein